MSAIKDIEGISFARGGDAALWQIPTRKTPTTVDWGDEEGLDVDLSRPLFEPVEGRVSLVLRPSLLSLLRSAIRQPSLSLLSLERTVVVRPRAVEELRHLPGGDYLRAELSFAVDDPMALWDALPTDCTPYRHGAPLLLGDQPLSTIGFAVGDCLDTMRRPRTIKRQRTEESAFRAMRQVYYAREPKSRLEAIRLPLALPRLEVGPLASLWQLIRQPGPTTLGGVRGYVSRVDGPSVGPTGVARFTLFFTPID